MDELLPVLRSSPGTGCDWIVSEGLPKHEHVPKFIYIQQEGLVVIGSSDVSTPR